MRLAWPVLLLLSISWTGCAYARDRSLDLTDVVDLKYGWGGHGIGVKVRASEIVGTGVGGGEWEDVVESVGRREMHDHSIFLAVGVAGVDGSFGPCPRELAEMNILFLRVPLYGREMPVSVGRFGGEVMLPFVRGGLFLSVGEVLDFLLGFTTLDIAKDDGLQPGAPLDSTPESHPIDEEKDSGEEREESR